jgi:hypothetical protein
MVQNIRFNGQANMLAGLQDSRLLIWPLPSVVFVDRDLLSRTMIEKEMVDFGKAPQIIS